MQEYAVNTREYAVNTREYASQYTTNTREYARIRENTQDMRRRCEQIFDNTQQICRIHTRILTKYARIRDRYSQYAAAYLRMELDSWLYQSWVSGLASITPCSNSEVSRCSPMNPHDDYGAGRRPRPTRA